MKLLRITRTKSKCLQCPLNGYAAKVRGESANERPKIAFIGEAPGREEDESGHPFVGSAGKELDRVLAKAGIHRHNAYLLNVINCRPPENDLDSPEGQEAVVACRPGFEEELSALYRIGVRTLVSLGASSTRALGIEGSIHKVRGSVYNVTIAGCDFWCVPTFHPSYIIRGQWSEEPTMIADVEKAVGIALNGYTPPKEDFLLFPTVRDIEAHTRDILRKRPLLGVDIETTGFSYWASEVFVMALATSSEEAFSIPFYSKGFVPYWKNGDLNVVRNCLAEILERCPTMYQNAPFDVSHLEHQGFKVGNIAHDVLLIHHCLSGDTIVDTLKGSIPIKELEGKRDFWLVSHNGEEKVPKKAKICWKVGRSSNLIRVVFWSKDRSSKDSLYIDCTEDHEFPIQGISSKVKAIDLKPGYRFYRGKEAKHRVGDLRVHRWVWEMIHGEPVKSGYSVHHIDGNHWNNDPENLMEVTESEHQALHKENRYRANAAFQLKRRQILVQEVDVERIRHLYFNVGLSQREVARELDIDAEQVRKCFRLNKWKARSYSESNVLRWEKSSNCRVISVVPLRGEYDIYDIEVPETHCFSANGIIVGNSIHPELPHNLGYIVSIYGATAFWKDIKLRFPIMRQTDDEVLRTYNARDAVVLHQVLGPLLEDLRETATEHIYYNYSLKLLRPTLSLTYNGMLLNRSRLNTWRKELKRELETTEKELRALGNLPEGFNFQSPHHLSYWLYGELPASLPKWKEEIASYDAPNSRKKKASAKYVELQKRAGLYGKVKSLCHSKSKTKRTKTGFAKDEKALLLSKLAATTEIELLSSFRRPTPEHKSRLEELTMLRDALTLFQKRQKTAKLLSTYTDFDVAPDGRVHPNFKIFGTATGRLSSGEGEE